MVTQLHGRKDHVRPLSHFMLYRYIINELFTIVWVHCQQKYNSIASLYICTTRQYVNIAKDWKLKMLL